MDCSSRETPGGGVITPLLRKERQVLCHLFPIPLSFVPLTHILRWCAPAFNRYVRQSGLPLWANAGEQISLLCCAHMRLTVKWHWLHISASVINEYRKCSSSKQLITGRTDSGITWQLKKERGGVMEWNTLMLSERLCCFQRMIVTLLVSQCDIRLLCIFRLEECECAYWTGMNKIQTYAS